MKLDDYQNEEEEKKLKQTMDGVNEKIVAQKQSASPTTMAEDKVKGEPFGTAYTKNCIPREPGKAQKVVKSGKVVEKRNLINFDFPVNHTAMLKVYARTQGYSTFAAFLKKKLYDIMDENDIGNNFLPDIRPWENEPEGTQ